MLTKKQKRNNWILTVVLLIVSLLFLFPVIWMLANSFKPDAAITADMNSIFFDSIRKKSVHVLCSNIDRTWCNCKWTGRICIG